MTESSSASDNFDLAKLRELIAMMAAHGVTEVDLQGGDHRWRLRRGPREVHMAPAYSAPMPAPMFAQTGPGPATGPVSGGAPAPSGPAPAPVKEGIPIASPTVGTFYTAAAPGDEPFVSIGSKVTKETIVCIIEAMKVFNQIPAEVNGTIIDILVKNGDAVEFGQPLFLVKVG